MNSSGQHLMHLTSSELRLGIIGGSGLCRFPELIPVSTVRPETKYGFPLDEIIIGELGKTYVAFIPRHGTEHSIPPHKVPYKANLAALKSLGVKYVLATCIAGSLQHTITPGSMVVPDQFVNLTWGRDDTFETDKEFIHLPMGEPYCSQLREHAIATAMKLNLPIIPKGTVAVIQGPRFSTVTESRWLSANQWDIVNMTQYPECYFARELGLCYAAIAAVTDYDVGLQEQLVMNTQNMEEVLKIFRINIVLLKRFLTVFAMSSSHALTCSCSSVMLRAYYEQ